MNSVTNNLLSKTKVIMMLKLSSKRHIQKYTIFLLKKLNYVLKQGDPVNVCFCAVT